MPRLPPRNRRLMRTLPIVPQGILFGSMSGCGLASDPAPSCTAASRIRSSRLHAAPRPAAPNNVPRKKTRRSLSLAMRLRLLMSHAPASSSAPRRRASPGRRQVTCHLAHADRRLGFVTAKDRRQASTFFRGPISKNRCERQNRMSNSMKKLVWPRMTGTRLLRVQAKARRTGANGPILPVNRMARAAESAMFPPSRTGTVCRSQTAPSSSPKVVREHVQRRATIDQRRHPDLAVAKLEGDWCVRQRTGRTERRIGLNVIKTFR